MWNPGNDKSRRRRSREQALLEQPVSARLTGGGRLAIVGTRLPGPESKRAPSEKSSAQTDAWPARSLSGGYSPSSWARRVSTAMASGRSDPGLHVRHVRRTNKSSVSRSMFRTARIQSAIDSAGAAPRSSGSRSVHTGFMGRCCGHRYCNGRAAGPASHRGFEASLTGRTCPSKDARSLGGAFGLPAEVSLEEVVHQPELRIEDLDRHGIRRQPTIDRVDDGMGVSDRDHVEPSRCRNRSAYATLVRPRDRRANITTVSRRLKGKSAQAVRLTRFAEIAGEGLEPSTPAL